MGANLTLFSLTADRFNLSQSGDALQSGLPAGSESSTEQTVNPTKTNYSVSQNSSFGLGDFVAVGVIIASVLVFLYINFYLLKKGKEKKHGGM